MDEVDEPDPVVDWESDLYDSMRPPPEPDEFEPIEFPEFEVLVEEPYCQLCEQYGHTVRSCPTRDDSDEQEIVDFDPGPEVDDEGGMSEVRRSVISWDAAAPPEYWLF